MSGCLSLCPYNMNTNIVPESPNPIPIPIPISVPSSMKNSIRRSMSADMSNQKWLQNNECPLKRVQSSEQLQVLGEEDDGMVKKGDDGGEDGNKGGSGGAAFEDIWSSILSQKKLDGSGQVPPPYVHPLVKRSTSSLSEKSLEICTESLGSETGSDGLFSYPASEHGECGDEREGEEEEEEVHEVDEERSHVEEMRGNVEVAKYNYPANNKKMGAPKSFPPPLPSLAHRDDGSNLHMRTHRQDGRLVVEAVAVPSQNCFLAQRHNGRLLLTLTNDDQQVMDGDGDGDEMGLEDEIFDDDEEVAEDDADEEKAVGKTVEKVGKIVMEETSKMGTGGSRIINVRNTCSDMIMSKLMEVTSSRSRSRWPRSYNKPVINSLLQHEDVEEVKVEPKQKATNLLPPRPRPSTATAAALNAYEYYWRRSDSPTAAALAVLKPLAGKHTVSPQVVKQRNRNNNTFLLASQAVAPQEEVVLLKAAAVAVGGVAGDNPEHLVPMFRGCKDPRRSLFFWGPSCIPTS